MAESAVIGLLRTLLASARSTMTTWLASLTFSRTQMKWSDSNVRVYRKRHAQGEKGCMNARTLEGNEPGRRWRRVGSRGQRAGDVHRTRWALRYPWCVEVVRWDTSNPSQFYPAAGRWVSGRGGREDEGEKERAERRAVDVCPFPFRPSLTRAHPQPRLANGLVSSARLSFRV